MIHGDSPQVAAIHLDGAKPDQSLPFACTCFYLFFFFPLGEIPVWQLLEDGGFISLWGSCFLSFSVHAMCTQKSRW